MKTGLLLKNHNGIERLRFVYSFEISPFLKKLKVSWVYEEVQTNFQKKNTIYI